MAVHTALHNSRLQLTPVTTLADWRCCIAILLTLRTYQIAVMVVALGEFAQEHLQVSVKEGSVQEHGYLGGHKIGIND
jgi:hypothetical protein